MGNLRRVLALAFCFAFSFRAGAGTLYVDFNSANPLPPFSSWATAATNIQDALDASQNGDTVLVTNGVYSHGGVIINPHNLQVTNRVALTNAVTLLSVNGPAVTTISGGPNQNRCAYVGSNALLSGFTLSGGNIIFGSTDTNEI